MKKQGYQDITVESRTKWIRTAAKRCDINNTDAVKEYIASKNCSNAHKENLLWTFQGWFDFLGVKWDRPFYQREEKGINPPSPREVGELVASAGQKYATILRLIAETGLRPCEVHKMRPADFNPTTNMIAVRTAKGGRGRTLEVSPQLSAMLIKFFEVYKQFPSPKGMYSHFRRLRNKVSEKLCNPRFRKIRLYDFRHYFATMMYVQTKDILYVKEKLGHRRLENTLVYTHLVHLKSENFICKTAQTVGEAKALVEAGFEYITDVQGEKLFRKLTSPFEGES